MKIGIIEGFFGPSWSMEQRKSWAPWMKKNGGDLFIYAPKEDSALRKKWQEPWADSYLNKLKSLSAVFRGHGIKFGIGFSPFGLDASNQNKVEEKISVLNGLGLDYLGIFFDDMAYTPDLLDRQLSVLDMVQKKSSSKIIFCPSYYTFDPILDKFFGPRPANYLSDLGSRASSEIDILWTGPKVISPEISKEHLIEVSMLLKRPPLLWDNFYANDGPKQCKFLKIKSCSGRKREALDLTASWVFNPMNQSTLSQIVLLTAIYAFRGEEGDLLEKAIQESVSPNLSEAILNNLIMLTKNIDEILPADREHLLKLFQRFNEPAAEEIYRWLQGKYTVGSECLTD